MDGGWGEFAGQAIIAVIGGAWALHTRRKQNVDMVDDQKKKVADPLAARVGDLETAVTGLKALISVETDKIRNLDQTMQSTRTDIAELKTALPRVEEVLSGTNDLLSKTLNFYERLQAKALKEEPIPGSGGLARLTRKGENDNG